MADVAVVAHSRKSLGGGLLELRRILELEGVTSPSWYKVQKSRRAPKYARKAAAMGVGVLFVWGSDGTVQRCIDAVAGTDTAVAILPAATANLLEANLQVPQDIEVAVRIGLHGDRRRLDTGSVAARRHARAAHAAHHRPARRRMERLGNTGAGRSAARRACRGLASTSSSCPTGTSARTRAG